MSIPAIAPSPVARLLLELEARKATGGLSVGGRRLVLTEGALVEVRPHAEDASLGDFLVATGRLTEEQLDRAKQEASAKRQALETVLRSSDLVPMDVLLDTRRALWLDRFVRGLANEENSGVQPALLSPEPHASQGPAIGTLSFVLDGLTRRAGYAGDAERVGHLAQAWFEWLDTPQRARASAWADLGEVPSAVLAGTLFPKHPAAPPRIAALVRAGLARLSERRSNLPPAAPRNPTFAAPAPEGRSELSNARRSFTQQLAPGSTHSSGRPIGIAPVRSWFPAQTGTLNDPLDALERQIAQLEQTGAAPAERARAWLELALGFRTHFDALDEAARAAREAVAADPNHSEALDLAATLCSATARPDLAFAYAAGLAATLHDAGEKAQALVRVAEYGLRADKPGSALRALRQAVELRPDEPSYAERYAQCLLSRGDLEQALRVAQQAANQYRARRPDVARALLAWAHEISPYDPSIATELASVLASDGFGEAAIAHVARAARNTRDADVAGRLWLQAGVRAEMIARPDLAADLLLEAARRAPLDDTAYVEPAIEALSATGSAADVFVVATELASRVHGEMRATCLMRAAEARLELPGTPEPSLELATQALIADPKHERALALVEQLGRSTPAGRGIVDALERALCETRETREQLRPLLGRFLGLTASEGLPALERWAWSSWASLTGEGPSAEQQRALEGRVQQFEAQTQALEAALREAPIETRTAAAVRLADHLRNEPAQRSKARKLYEKVLEHEPDHATASAGLEALLRLEDQPAALAQLLVQRVARSLPGPGRVGVQLALIQHERLRGELESARNHALQLLAETPRHREGLLLLQRIALALGSTALERDVLGRRVEASNDPRERARLLCQLARLHAAEADPGEACKRAEQALGSDPRCAEAALMLVEHNGLLDPARRVAALRGGRVVLGDTPHLMRLLAQASFGTRDARGQLEALETLMRLSPLDPFPALGLATLRATGRDAQAIIASVQALTHSGRRAENSAEAARAGLARLWTLGHRREAAELSLQVVDALGEAGDELTTWSLPYVREADDPKLARAVVERIVARSRGEARRAELRRLAHLCRNQGARAAEARVYLRLLAVEPRDTEALDRLTSIYAETRELERLTAVLTLRTNLARTSDERREHQLSLALAALELMGDAASAADLVRAALAPEKSDTGLREAALEDVRRGVGLLLGSPAPRAAFDLLLELSEESTPQRARELLEEAVYLAEQELRDPELALRAATLGLEAHPFHTAFLLHFERLALELSDIATGREVYRHLAETSVGSHGKRAVLYRAARFLERAGALQDALEMAEQAFMLAPSEGAVLSALTRFAQATGQYDGLVRALIALAAEPIGAPRKGELLSRAATLCEEQLRDEPQAARLFVQAFAVSGQREHETRATALLTRISLADPQAARQLGNGMRDALTGRAKDARALPDRLAALLSLSELSLALYASDDAASYAQAARQALETLVAQGESEQSRALAERLERVQALLPRKEARGSVPRASERPSVPRPTDPPDRPPVTPRWSEPRRTQGPYGRPSLRETLRPHATLPPNLDPRATLPGYVGAASPEPLGRRALRVEARTGVLSAEEDALLHGLATGQPEALQRLTETSGAPIEQSAKLCEALLARARKGQLSMVCFRGLWLLSERAHRTDVRAVVSELLSHVDPAIAGARGARLPNPSDEVTRNALNEARDDGDLSHVFNALGQVFLGGGPLFRRPLGAYGVSTNDFIAARDDSAYADALRDVSLVLGVEHEAYLTPSGRDSVGVVATYPPSLVVGDGTALAPVALRFRLGTVFELARPSSVLLATLGRDAMVTLLQALRAAFGASDSSSASVHRDAAAMAAELWRTLPSATQKQISSALRNDPREFAYDALLDQLKLRAARVGLITAGALDVALDNLELDVQPPGPRVPATEAGMSAALLERPVLSGLLSFALSDAYLALRSRESS